MHASEWQRLFASLALSCLLHAALFYLPYLGIVSGASRPAPQGGQRLAPPRTLEVTLVFENIPVLAVAAPMPPAGEEGSRADAPGESRVHEEPRPAASGNSGVDLPPGPVTLYYPTDQLTKRPQPTATPELDTPEIQPIISTGKIVLKVWIDESGKVTSVQVAETDLPQAFANNAVAALGKLRFIPGERNGERVGSMVRIEISYDDFRRPRP